ncbi:MAG: hypothetical protein CMB81_01045 [Flammeovirgaceae bacterium]|nr:hypothetical protein [Flammeovirgaceae bacterium]
MEVSFLINILIFLLIATFYITIGSLFFAPFFVKIIEPILFRFFKVNISPTNRYYISFIISGLTFLIIILFWIFSY